MRKIFKIIIVVFVVLIVAGISSIAVVVSDLAGNLATDTHPLPNGTPIGQAIVVYDPGLSGGAKDAATKIGYNLQSAGYNVVLAGVKSSTAANLTGYDVVAIGGPIYGGSPASTINAYLSTMSAPANAKVGVFGYGDIAVDNSDSAAVQKDVAGTSTLTFNAVEKITAANIDSQTQQFVTNLLK